MDQTEQAPAAPATPASTYAEFSSVFDELMEPTPTLANTDTTTSPAALQAAADATPKTEPESETPVNPASGESATPAVPAVAAEPSAPVVEGGTADEAATAGASQAATDWEAKYKELQAQQAAAAQAPPAQAAVPPPPVQQAEPELYNADEKAALARFDEDWPDVAKASQLRMRGELTAAVRHVFQEIKRVYDPLITQALQSTASLEDHTVVGEIRKGHTDYNEALHAEVSAWVGTLKGMQRRVYEAVVEAGEPDEVIDLISEFKKATGRAVPAIPAKSAVATPAGKVTNISEAAKKAAKAMGVVEGKRTATTAAVDPNDFDAAWAEAIAEK